MKKISLALILAVSGWCFTACSDTTDCLCEVETEAVQKAAYKTTTYKPVYDWDGRCSDITAQDIPGLSDNPCTEQ